MICKRFNDYFVTVANDMNSEKYNGIPPPDYREFLSGPVESSIFLSDITEDEICEIIKQLDNSKSCDISPKLLKSLIDSFLSVLCFLFNSCMLSGVFPDELKIAKVIPLFKSGSSNVMSNYRPISILPTLSKVFEKLIYKRLYTFFEDKEVIHNNQYGFRYSHSTVHAVQTAINSVVTSLNRSHHSMGIFIDFSKAFDTIQHKILLDKLYNYGIRGISHELINDYLTNRKQYVFYDNKCYSVVNDISVGVPQGSVLGPLFFIIYVNDICNGMGRNVSFIMFADDTNIFISAQSIDELYSIANDALRWLNVYIDANFLHINLKKSKYMIFRSCKDLPHAQPLFFNDFELERVTSIKFLGIVLDESLVWHEHIKSLTRKVNKITGSLFKIRKCLPEELMRSVYFALVNSQLNYGITLWGSAGSVSNLSSLFSAQKKSLRALLHIPRISKYCPGHTKCTFNKMHIPTVHNLYYMSILTSTFKAIYSLSPKAICDQYTIHISKRKSTLFLLPKMRLSGHHKNQPYASLKIWNTFMNLCTSLGILDRTLLFTWKCVTFKKYVKSFFLNAQNLLHNEEWQLINYNIYELENTIVTGSLDKESRNCFR